MVQSHTPYNSRHLAHTQDGGNPARSVFTILTVTVLFDGKAAKILNFLNL